MSVPDAIHDAFDEFEDRSYDYSIGKGSADDALAARDNLFKAIAAATFSDEERTACAALARLALVDHDDYDAGGDWLRHHRLAREAVDALPLDVLKRLAQEEE